MIETIEELKTALPAIFEGDDYQTRRRAIDEEFRSVQESQLDHIAQKARGQSIALMRTPTGFAMAPMHEGKVIERPVFEALPKETQEDFESKIEALQKELQDALEQMPRGQKERRRRLMELNEEVAGHAVRQAIGDVEAEFADLPDITAHLEEARSDLIRNVGVFLSSGEDGEGMVSQPVDTVRDARFRRYLVNVVIADGHGADGAPIVEELNPTYGNLMGRV